MAVSYKNTTLKSTNVRFNNNLQQIIFRYLFLTVWALSKRFSKIIVRRFFFRPAGYKPIPEQQAILSRATVFSFESQGKTLQAYKWGEGPAVIFVHGWAGRGAQFYRYVPALLSKGYSVLTFDHAGHGNSQGKTANYFLFSNAMFDFCNYLTDIRIHAIVAHSLGASATINYLWRSQHRPVTIFIAPALRLIEMLHQTFDRIGLPKRIFTALINEIGGQTGHTFSEENPIDLLKTIHHEILIIHDTDDRAVSFEDSWNASLMKGNIKLLPTKGLGHIRILEDDAIVEHVVNKISAAL